jgi:hypothetical protein
MEMVESFVYQAAPMRGLFASGRLADLAADLSVVAEAVR